MPTEAEIAWAAGFFEGEGYFCATKHNLKRTGPRLYPKAGINNTNREMLVRFQRIVGVGKIHSRSVSYSPFNAKPQWTWLAQKREEFEHVFQILEPWLSEERKSKALSLRDELGALTRFNGEYMKQRAAR